MHITEVKVGVSVTVNLGNFNNVKIESSVTAELYENETIADIVVRLQEELFQPIRKDQGSTNQSTSRLGRGPRRNNLETLSAPINVDVCGHLG